MVSILTLSMVAILIVGSQQRQQEHDPQMLIGVEPGTTDSSMIIFYKTPPLNDYRNRTEHKYSILLFSETSATTIGPTSMFNLTHENATNEIKTFVIDSYNFLPGQMYVICVQTIIVQNNGITLTNGKSGKECAANRTTSNGTVLVPPKVTIGSMTGDTNRGFQVTLHVPVELPYLVRRMDAKLQGRSATGLSFAQNSTHQQVTFVFTNVADLNQLPYELCAWTDFSGPLIAETPWVFDQCFSITSTHNSATGVSATILFVLLSFGFTTLA